MNLSKFLLYPLVALTLGASISSAAQMKLSTYYPSPTGSYNNFTATTATITTLLGGTATQHANDTVYLGDSVGNNFFFDRPGISGQMIFGYNTAESTAGIDTLQIYDNSAVKHFLLQAHSGGSAGGSDAVYLVPVAGDVGVGTSSPSHLLEVGSGGATGKLYVNSQDNGNGQIQINNPNGGEASIGFLQNYGVGWVIGAGPYSTGTSFDIGNGTIGANGFVMTAAGSVGIGTANPGSPLTVVRQDNTENAIATFDPLNLTQSVNIAYNRIFEAGTNGTNALYIDSQATGSLFLQSYSGTGNVVVGNGLETKGSITSWNGEAPFYGGSPEIFVNGDNHTGGGISISDDGGFFDYNNGWITYNGSTGILISGNNGAGCTTCGFTSTNMGVAGGPFYGGSPHLVANGDDHTGGGIAISNDGGFYDYNDSWITYNGSTGIKLAGNNGASSTGGKLQINGAGSGFGTFNDGGCGNNYTGITLNGQTPSGCTNYNVLSSPTDTTLYLNRPTGASMVFRVNNASANQAYFDSSNNLTVNGNITASGTITATTVTGTSDRRFKMNIVPLTDTLSKLDQLRGVSYQWNHLATTIGLKEGQKNIGMIAQELQKVYPELVVPVHNGNQDYLTIDYPKFTAVLLQSVKELKAQVNDLQAQVKVLQEKQKG